MILIVAGSGSILSQAAGSSAAAGSILKTSSRLPPLPPKQQQAQQPNTTNIETKQLEINSFTIPPGFALIPLNHEQSGKITSFYSSRAIVVEV